jgi:hypothetical protein
MEQYIFGSRKIKKCWQKSVKMSGRSWNIFDFFSAWEFSLYADNCVAKKGYGFRNVFW